MAHCGSDVDECDKLNGSKYTDWAQCARHWKEGVNLGKCNPHGGHCRSAHSLCQLSGRWQQCLEGGVPSSIVDKDTVWTFLSLLGHPLSSCMYPAMDLSTNVDMSPLS